MVPFGPLVHWTIVLDGSEFSVLLFDEEEICGIRTPQFPDCSSFEMFGYKFLRFGNFALGEGKKSTR